MMELTMNSIYGECKSTFVTKYSKSIVVGGALMAPVNPVQADWLDVEDFGCVGVNTCKPETCTDTSVVDVALH